jgi:hypothetical protein
MRFSRLTIYFNAFHLILKNKDSCLKMIIKTEICSIVEYNKFMTVKYILMSRSGVITQ